MPLKKNDGDGPELLEDIQRPQRRQALLPLATNAQFRYWVDPNRVTIRGGKARYEPIRVSVRDGLQGVVHGDPTLMDAAQAELGRIPVPGDFPCYAWGEKVKGYRLRTFIGEDARGKKLHHFHDVWTRHQPVGNRLVTEFDSDGWARFCKDVEKLVGSPPHAAIAEAEAARLRAAARLHRSIAHASPGALALAEELEERASPEG